MYLTRKLLQNVLNEKIQISCVLKKYASTKAEELRKRQTELMARGLPKIKPIPGVKNIILVSSGKGGVGKSTTAVNLAASLKIIKPNISIGLLDADVFGPSVPLMMNLKEAPLLDENNMMIPLTNYGIQCMSMGFLVEEGAPVIWRGLMVMQALQKLMYQVKWGEVDCLIVDTPPGTGDTHLSLIQNLPIQGAVLITTPHNASLQVTKRGAKMLKKLNIPIIGIVENMSSIKCPNCLSNVKLFGMGTDNLAEELAVPVLVKIPLNQQISEDTDKGVPLVIGNPKDDEAAIYKNLADKVYKFIFEKL